MNRELDSFLVKSDKVCLAEFFHTKDLPHFFKLHSTLTYLLIMFYTKDSIAHYSGESSWAPMPSYPHVNSQSQMAEKKKVKRLLSESNEKSKKSNSYVTNFDHHNLLLTPTDVVGVFYKKPGKKYSLPVTIVS